MARSVKSQNTNELKPDGIETNYILVNKENEKIDEIDRWNEFANKNNLFVSIGSDFHRFGNNHPVVGLVGENIKISNEEKEMARPKPRHKLHGNLSFQFHYFSFSIIFL